MTDETGGLRNEILNNQNIVNGYLQFLLSAAGILFGTVLSKTENTPIKYLAIYLITIPVLSFIAVHVESTARIAEYMNVFGMSEWEHALSVYREVEAKYQGDEGYALSVVQIIRAMNYIGSLATIAISYKIFLRDFPNIGRLWDKIKKMFLYKEGRRHLFVSVLAISLAIRQEFYVRQYENVLLHSLHENHEIWTGVKKKA